VIGARGLFMIWNAPSYFINQRPGVIGKIAILQ